MNDNLPSRAGPAGPSSGQGQPAASGNSAVDCQHRTRVNLLAVIAITLLGAGIYLTMHYISETRQTERCVDTGRRDCFSVPDPQGSNPGLPR